MPRKKQRFSEIPPQPYFVLVGENMFEDEAVCHPTFESLLADLECIGLCHGCNSVESIYCVGGKITPEQWERIDAAWKAGYDQSFDGWMKRKYPNADK